MASKIASACSNYHILNLIGGYRVSYGLFAALNHGIFEYLETNDGGRTARQTAKDLTLDETATTVLLDNCTSVDLLVKEIPAGKMKNALYSNSDQTKRYLLPKSPESIYGYAILEARTLSKLVANFEHVVKEGKSQWERTFGMSSEETFANLYENRESLIEFEEGMGSRMKMSMSAVLGAFDLSGFSHLCDLGGLLSLSLESVNTNLHALCYCCKYTLPSGKRRNCSTELVLVYLKPCFHDAMKFPDIDVRGWDIMLSFQKLFACLYFPMCKP